jgi:hypothetical protein
MPVFEIPFLYLAKVVPQGKRKPLDRTFASSVMVEIPSVPADEAPLMLRWHRQRWEGNGWHHPPHDYRQYGDALFKPVFYEYSGRPDRHVSLEEALVAAGEGYRGRQNPLFAGSETGHLNREPRMRVEDLVGHAVRSTEEAEIAAKVRALASDLVAVDGLLFRRARGGEPIYDLSRGYVDIKELDRTKPEDRDIRTHFRADQIAEVLEFRRLVDPEDFAQGAEIDLDDPATYRMHLGQFIEVFDPSCLRYRADQGPKLLDYAGKVVASARKEIGDAPVEAMIAYARLRDGMKAGAGAPVICGMLEAYADTLPDRDGIHALFGGGDRDQILRETEIYRMSPTPETEPPAPEGPRP